MLNYYADHLQKYYTAVREDLPGLRLCTNGKGWEDYYFGPELLFSHRINTYTMANFPDKLHTHNFFEMDVIFSGQISYIISDHEVIPRKGGILLFPPGVLHTGRLIERSEFDRMVFYFSPRAFSFLGSSCLPALFQKSGAGYLTIDGESRAPYYYLLQRLEDLCARPDASTGLLGLSYIIQLFHLISAHSQMDREHLSALPSNILAIKGYIDENYQSLSSISDIADYFFYSREYISRIFKEYFNTNISEYLLRKRIDAAKAALEEGQSVTQAFSVSGYRSMSSFINAFRKRTSLSPSLYRKRALKGS